MTPAATIVDGDRQVQLDRQQPRRIGADREQAGLSERDHAGGAGDQRQADRQHGVEPADAERLQHVAVAHDQRQRERHDGERHDEPQRHANGRARRDEGAGERLGRQGAAAAEDAVRLEHEDQDHHHEGEQVAVARAERRDAVALDQAEQQAAGDRARHVAHAADHLRDDALQAGLKAHVGVDRVVIHADEKAGHAAERRRDREHRAVHAVDVDAALLRGVAVERGRPHRPAELGEAQEDDRAAARWSKPDAGDQNVERPDGAAADLDAPVGQLAAARRAGRA